jgi:hypothetical protein
MALTEDLFNGYCPPLAVTMVPATARAARVARGIYSSTFDVDFLSDRIGTYAASTADAKELSLWINDNYNKIVDCVRQAALPDSSEEFVEYNNGAGHFKATPNHSYGYLYCAFWLE